MASVYFSWKRLCSCTLCGFFLFQGFPDRLINHGRRLYIALKKQTPNAQTSVLPSNSELSCSGEWNPIVPFVPGIAGIVVRPDGIGMMESMSRMMAVSRRKGGSVKASCEALLSCKFTRPILAGLMSVWTKLCACKNARPWRQSLRMSSSFVQLLYVSGDSSCWGYSYWVSFGNRIKLMSTNGWRIIWNSW